MEVPRCSQVTTLGRGIAHSLATALLLGAIAACGEELTPEVGAPLLEFKARRLAIEEKAAADTKKELRALANKLEKLSKSGNKKNPKVSEQAAAILKEVEDPTFLIVGINRLMNNVEGGVTGQQAHIINLAYTQGRVTAEDWAKLPGDALKVKPLGTGTDIDVQPGDFILVCPHPDQKWRLNAESSWTAPVGKMALVATIKSEKNPEKFPLTPEKGVLFECSVKGRLSLGSNVAFRNSEGSIECKVFKITQR